MEHPETYLQLMRLRQAELRDDAERRRLARLAAEPACGGRRPPSPALIDLRLPWGGHLRFGSG